MKSIKVARLFNIDVELHYSWFFIFALLAWGLSSSFFPDYSPGLSQAAYWTIGILSSLLLFISVLIHELSHSLVARKNGIEVKRITLFFFGGIANIEGEEKLTAKKEFKIAIAGPAISILLAIVFYGIFIYSNIIYLTAMTNYLFRLNLILGLFNLAPGFPLDGGRVLRSIIWGITKDLKKATKIAANGGKVVAVFLIAFGFIGMFLGLGTLWFIILGFFLYFIAGASYEQMLLSSSLKKLKIKDVMIKKITAVSPDISLADLFEKFFLKYGAEGSLVAKDHIFLGVITMDQLKAIPKKEWPKVKVKDILDPAKKIATAKESDSALQTFSRMSKQKIAMMPVIKNKKLIGAISIASLIRYVNLHQ